MEQLDNRKPGYQIHHLDTDIHNNHIDNLVLITDDEHKNFHKIKRKNGELIEKYSMLFINSL